MGRLIYSTAPLTVLPAFIVLPVSAGGHSSTNVELPQNISVLRILKAGLVYVFPFKFASKDRRLSIRLAVLASK